jgi:2-polyprenyl-3-methyl-5-hydroxy-6-metoxy-1,4-benzoquinol methylase
MAIEKVGGGAGPTGEYAHRGEYHRNLDPDWDYYPTYLAKMAAVRAYLGDLPPATHVLDAGCGEGVLVDEFASRLDMVGVDANFSSARVRAGSILDLPFGPESFDRVLCLDVLEHLQYDHQTRAVAEIFRVLRSNGEVLLSIPNLAHLQSRLKFLLTGKLVRTSNTSKHPGDRPIEEYLELARRAGFEVVRREGILPTVPVLTRLIRKNPRKLAWLHRLLTRLLPVPGWCFLNLIWLNKPAPEGDEAA